MPFEKLIRRTAALRMIGLASVSLGGCGGRDPAPATSVNPAQSGIPNVAPLPPAAPQAVAWNTPAATGATNPGSTNPTAPATPSDGGSDSDPFAAAKKVVAANNCGRCHAGLGGAGMGAAGPGGGFPAGTAGGPGGGAPGGGFGGGGPPGGGRPGMAKGPDLSHVGADANHTTEWLMQHIRNPKSHKPESRMPAFDKISDNDLRLLAEYLASLK